jgi:soluble lytic murein transglycosylase-like protein
MQLMPETASRFGVNNLNNIEENIRGGAKYLKYLLKKFNGNTKLAIAAYNAGENTIAKYNGVPPYPETKRYLHKVLSLYRQFLHNENFF